jgi:hypothetical protein
MHTQKLSQQAYFEALLPMQIDINDMKDLQTKKKQVMKTLD